jgi:exodeoxyribonuclease VII large subunit
LARVVTARKDRFTVQSSRFRPEALQADLDRKAERYRDVVRRLADAGLRNTAALRERVEAADRLRLTLGYEATLERGFAVVRSDGAVVTDSKTAKAAATLEIQFSDGRVTVGGKPAARKPGGKPSDGEQGSLF